MSTYTMAAVQARTLTGEMVPMDASQAGEGKLAFTMRVPIGVVGAISPFNFPLNLVAHKIAPALAAGCAVVLKPDPQTPLTVLRVAELAAEVGFPPGVINIVPGDGPTTGAYLVRHPGVDKSEHHRTGRGHDRSVPAIFESAASRQCHAPAAIRCKCACRQGKRGWYRRGQICIKKN